MSFPKKRHAGKAKTARTDEKSARLKRPILRMRDGSYRKKIESAHCKPLGLCGQWLPELNLIPVQVVDPGEATVGFIHSSVVNLHPLLF